MLIDWYEDKQNVVVYFHTEEYYIAIKSMDECPKYTNLYRKKVECGCLRHEMGVGGREREWLLMSLSFFLEEINVPKLDCHDVCTILWIS